MDNRVYRAIAELEEHALREHPTATRVKVLWTPAGETEFCVEVWHGAWAKVHRADARA